MVLGKNNRQSVKIFGGGGFGITSVVEPRLGKNTIAGNQIPGEGALAPDPQCDFNGSEVRRGESWVSDGLVCPNRFSDRM